MSAVQTLSPAAQHYSGLLQQLHSEQLAEAINDAVWAQESYNDAVKYGLNDQERRYFELSDARNAFWAALDKLEIDRALFREMVL